MSLISTNHGTRIETASIRHRALESARREFSEMKSELENYGECFSGPQLLAMRKAMRGLRDFIKSLE